MAVFPSAIATLRALVNRAGSVYDATKTKVFYAEDQNLQSAEIVAIENVLGISPAGAYTTVGLRIAAQEARTIPVKATGAEINTGTNDAKFATPKAIADSNVAFLSDIPTLPVKASGAEVTTGTDDAKFATAKALADAGVNTRLASKIIVTTRDATAGSGDVAYSGIGFKPTALIALGGINGNTGSFAIGMADSNLFEADIYGNSNTTNYLDNYLIEIVASAGNNQLAVLKTFDTDGFTLTWTKNGSPTGTIELKIMCLR